MATASPLDEELDTRRGHFRVTTGEDHGAYATTIWRRFPDGPYAESYRQPATSQEEATANHQRIVAAVKADELP